MDEQEKKDVDGDMAQVVESLTLSCTVPPKKKVFIGWGQ
jgi:hypothetical protein